MKKDDVRPGEDIPPCFIHIDKDARWRYRGTEMVQREIIRLFYERLEIDSSGQYTIRMGNERCRVEVEDAAYVVRKVRYPAGALAEDAPILLLLSDDVYEPLAAETLYVGEKNVLYCMVKNRTFPARFSRPAYYQLAERIDEEAGSFFLRFGGKRNVILAKGGGS